MNGESEQLKLSVVAEKWPRRLFNKNTALCKVDYDAVYGVMPAQCPKVKGRC